MNRSLLMAACAATALTLVSVAKADVELGDGTILSAEPYYIVTYVEVAPSADDEAEDLIEDFVEASAHDDGLIRFEAVQREGRDNHFVILEIWEDQASRDAHAVAGHTVSFRQALQPHLYNPYDERPHVGLSTSDAASIVAGDDDFVYVVTHVDIIPPEQFPECSRQVDPGGPCGNALVEQLAEASRGHDGNLRFDVLTQANRPNHMTVVEMWVSEDAQEAHTVHDDVRNFRDALSGIVPGSGVHDDPLFVLNPLTGSLYDERLYELVD